jgi:hypothetical protein
MALSLSLIVAAPNFLQNLWPGILEQLLGVKRRYPFYLYAYVLMPNQFNLTSIRKQRQSLGILNTLFANEKSTVGRVSLSNSE